MKKSARHRPTPPKNLSREAKGLWRRVLETWVFDDDLALQTLENYCTAFDRMRQAQELIAKDGVTVKDRFNQEKQHPATLVERDAKATMERCRRSLGVDLEPVNDRPGRPPGLRLMAR